MATSGQRVGEYVLDEIVGRGAFGEVWRARHHVWADRVAAIKLPTDPSYVRELQREGLALPQVEHPNIVKAIGFDPFATPPYLAMEYVPGTSLRPLIAAKKLSIDDAVAVTRQVLAALSAAHAAGVVHRDVKPENVLIHERRARDGWATPGVVKLSDFGLGQAAKSVAAESIAMSIRGGGNGATELVGTIDYMPPEQRAGGAIDGRADLYGVGVMLFEMLTSEKPVGGEKPSDLNPRVPAELDAAFKRAYARRESRFASADEFAAALVGKNSTADRPPLLPTRRGSDCPTCRGPIEPTDQFCIHCGTQVVAHVLRCDRCGAYPAANVRFCIRCGEAVNFLAAAR